MQGAKVVISVHAHRIQVCRDAQRAEFRELGRLIRDIVIRKQERMMKCRGSRSARAVKTSDSYIAGCGESDVLWLDR